MEAARVLYSEIGMIIALVVSMGTDIERGRTHSSHDWQQKLPRLKSGRVKGPWKTELEVGKPEILNRTHRCGD
jgi:hypothetical protein